MTGTALPSMKSHTTPSKLDPSSPVFLDLGLFSASSGAFVCCKTTDNSDLGRNFLAMRQKGMSSEYG